MMVGNKITFQDWSHFPIKILSRNTIEYTAAIKVQNMVAIPTSCMTCDIGLAEDAAHVCSRTILIQLPASIAMYLSLSEAVSSFGFIVHPLAVIVGIMPLRCAAD